MNALHVIDVSVIPDEELKTHRSIALVELLQKHIDDRDNFEPRFKKWIEEYKLYEHISVQLFKLAITYTLQLAQPKDPKTLIKVIENSAINEEYKVTMQTVAQYLQQQGMLLGMNEAKREDARKMFAEGISREVIKRVTGLSDIELDIL